MCNTSIMDRNEDTRNPCFFPFRFNVVRSEQLEHQFVRIDSIWETERRTQVPTELRHLLDSCKDLWIHCLLVWLALLRYLVFLGSTKSNVKILPSDFRLFCGDEKIQGKPRVLAFSRNLFSVCSKYGKGGRRPEVAERTEATVWLTLQVSEPAACCWQYQNSKRVSRSKKTFNWNNHCCCSAKVEAEKNPQI